MIRNKESATSDMESEIDRLRKKVVKWAGGGGANSGPLTITKAGDSLLLDAETLRYVAGDLMRIEDDCYRDDVEWFAVRVIEYRSKLCAMATSDNPEDRRITLTERIKE